ncbi:hypothetical protein E2C01_052553 [Portunus trituberculatus]|uniref:Uncharacterized protein n=1 Tax=Portunus trituberculatus TaxID=210409 RepID=A0A5B7GMS7_PORTR|nr:hypothetical protein [Portunus trituberculatus]
MKMTLLYMASSINLVPIIGDKIEIFEKIEKLKQCHEKALLGEENPTTTAKDSESPAPEECATEGVEHPAPWPSALPLTITWLDLQDYT